MNVSFFLPAKIALTGSLVANLQLVNDLNKCIDDKYFSLRMEYETG